MLRKHCGINQFSPHIYNKTVTKKFTPPAENKIATKLQGFIKNLRKDRLTQNYSRDLSCHWPAPHGQTEESAQPICIMYYGQ